MSDKRRKAVRKTVHRDALIRTVEGFLIPKFKYAGKGVWMLALDTVELEIVKIRGYLACEELRGQACYRYHRKFRKHKAGGG